ncbi:MAG: hypothetical protein AABY53_06410 [Bdellovibrionota bacterium]
MIGILASLVFSILFLYVSYIKRDNYYELVKHHLAIMPQAPVVMFLHHNLDKKSFTEPRWFLMLPVFISLAILSAATIRFFIQQKDKINVALSPLMIAYFAYSILCIISAVFSDNPQWGLYAILWTIPFGFIFFIAGRKAEDESTSIPLTLSVIFSCLLSFSIVMFALVTGMAYSLFYTRSYGSILSITGLLQMLILYVPLASFEVRKNKIINWIFWLLPPFMFALSLSRSAVVPAAVYLLTVIVHFKLDLKSMFLRPWFYVVSVILGISGMLVVSFTHVGYIWTTRFTQMDYAIQRRIEAFGVYWASATSGNPFYGVGYGLTKFHHSEGFTDLHNMLLTELYENGLGAAIMFGLVLIVAIYYILNSFFRRKSLIVAFAVLLTLILAHAQGINLAIRNPGAYNTPYLMCILFFMFGLLEKQAFGKK